MKKINLFSLILSLSIVIIIAFVSISCKSEANDIKKVIKGNIDALNKKDLSKAMSFIHPESPFYKETEEKIKTLFDDYELHYKIEAIDILSIKDPEKEALAKQKNKKGGEKKEEKGKKEEEETKTESQLLEDEFVLTEEERKAKELREKKKEEMERKKNPPLAKVKVIQLTTQLRKKGGSHQFLDNRAFMIHELIRTQQREWKIFKTVVRDVEFIPLKKD